MKRARKDRIAPGQLTSFVGRLLGAPAGAASRACTVCGSWPDVLRSDQGPIAEAAGLSETVRIGASGLRRIGQCPSCRTSYLMLELRPSYGVFDPIDYELHRLRGQEDIDRHLGSEGGTWLSKRRPDGVWALESEHEVQRRNEQAGSLCQPLAATPITPEQCRCSLWSRRSNADEMAAKGLVRMMRTDAGAGTLTLHVECTACGRGWSVEKDVGYHVPTFEWRPAARG